MIIATSSSSGTGSGSGWIWAEIKEIRCFRAEDVAGSRCRFILNGAVRQWPGICPGWISFDFSTFGIADSVGIVCEHKLCSRKNVVVVVVAVVDSSHSAWGSVLLLLLPFWRIRRWWLSSMPISRSQKPGSKRWFDRIDYSSRWMAHPVSESPLTTFCDGVQDWRGDYIKQASMDQFTIRCISSHFERMREWEKLISEWRQGLTSKDDDYPHNHR